MTGHTPFVLLAAIGLAFLLRTPETEDSAQPTLTLSFPVVLAITACALLPVAGGVIANLITHAFTPRYFIGAIPGVIILLAWGLRRIMRNDGAGPALATAICLVLFVQQWRELRSDQNSMLQELRSSATLLRRAGDGPILVSVVAVFHKLSFYGRRELVNKLVYTADPYLSVRYLGQDTVDRGLLALAPWFPLKVVWWHEWWSEHPYSLVYGDAGEWSWFTFSLHDIGNAELLSRDTDNLLFAVTRTTVPKDDRISGDPTGKPSMYDRLPKGGASLCSIYFPRDNCPVVDDPNLTVPMVAYPR